MNRRSVCLGGAAAISAVSSEARAMPSKPGRLVTEAFAFDGGRAVTAYLPAEPPQAIVYAADGQLTAPWGESLAAAGGPPTMVVGVHRVADETLRLHEYSPSFDPERFAAHEAFFVDEVRSWVRALGGELALALGLRHPQTYGAVFCASPGGGYRPPAVLPSPLPRFYLVAGKQEPFFQENAVRWETALRAAGADVVMQHRDGVHGGAFWQAELPLMAAWAFGA